MKYVLTSGCSFTNNVRFNPKEPKKVEDTRESWPFYLQKYLGGGYEVYNLGGATNDNVSICRILFYWIKKLISEGVDPKDIIVFGQWSDPNREAIWFRTDKFTEIERERIAHTLVYTDNWEKEKGMFFLTGGYSPPTDKGSAVDFLDIEDYILVHEVDLNRNNILNPTLRWLESWSHLELYCKSLGISTMWMTMRNIYSREAYENYFGAPENDSNMTSKNLWFKDYEILKPYIDDLPIDSKNHWHHKNYNGILEWTLENRWTEDQTPINPYQESVGMTWDEYVNHQSNAWGHPSPEMMDKFVSEELIKFFNNAING